MGSDWRRNLTRRVLTRVNRMRVATGREPLARLPKGIRSKPNACPLKNALDGKDVVVSRFEAGFRLKKMAVAAAEAWGTRVVGKVVVAALDIPRGWWSVKLPQDLKDFVLDFDNGFFPQYEEKRQYEEER